MRGRVGRKARIIILALGIGILAAILVVYAFSARGQTAKAGAIRAVSCSQADVQAAIDAAGDGETVSVPAGNCTWTNTLAVTKAVSIVGAGVGNTVIDKTDSGYSVSYTIPNPSAYSLFRLSGIEFDLDNMANGVYIENRSADHAARIRVDHNAFLNCGSYSYYTYGQVYGVIDNNTFTGNVWSAPYGNNATSWKNITFRYGSEENLYLEDNIFTQSGSSGLYQMGLGGILVDRYNTYTYTYAASSNFYPWDSHGNQQPGSNHSTMGTEKYGNKINANGKNVKLFYHRGGMALIFWNKIVNSNSAWQVVQEECDDCYYGHLPCQGPEGQPMHVSESYYWNNRYGNTGNTLISDITVTNSDDTCEVRNYLIAEDVDVFWQKSSFDGTSGVGCGTLADRPVTCTAGVAYWATEQSCTTIDDANVGAHPTAPISGTLYKCITPNTWTEYYTPYTYPHPLRGEATMVGDVNADGMVNINDIRACVGHILGTQDWGEAADVNGDGQVNALDIQMIVKIFSAK
jgi:hypothetical protein